MWAVEALSDLHIFGIRVPLIKPEYLLWIFLTSTTQADQANTLALIDSGKVAMPTFEELLKQHGASDALTQLKQHQVAIHTRHSSYTDSAEKLMPMKIGG